MGHIYGQTSSQACNQEQAKHVANSSCTTSVQSCWPGRSGPAGEISMMCERNEKEVFNNATSEPSDTYLSRLTLDKNISKIQVLGLCSGPNI